MKISFDLPDDLAARFAMAVPADERDAAFALAVREWLERITTVSKQVQKRMGRPPKQGGRKPVTVYMETTYLEKLDAIADKHDLSRSDVLNAVLQRALPAGFFAPPVAH